MEEVKALCGTLQEQVRFLSHHIFLQDYVRRFACSMAVIGSIYLSWKGFSQVEGSVFSHFFPKLAGCGSVMTGRPVLY